MTLVDVPVRTRPFASSCFAGGRERELLLDALESGHWSGFRAGTGGRDAREICTMTSAAASALGPADIRFLGGRYVRLLEARFAERTGCAYAIACNSATSGLVMAIGAIGIQPGDEILVPCMSFHATATAVLPFGGVPVFVEVDPATLCIDPVDAETKITARTRAILPVHLGGVPAAMNAILALARRYGLKVIEDCAQAIGARHGGREAGSLGDAGVFSLTETKSITCGEGGVVVTNDPSIAMKCRLIRNHGEGAADERWSEEELRNVIGMNFRLTELQAAVAVAQYEQLDERNRIRNQNARYLIERLPFIPQRVDPGDEPAYYVLKFRDRDRDDWVRRLAAQGIPAVAGYPRLLHEKPLFAAYGACPRSEGVNRELFWFAFIHPPNTLDDMDDVVRAFEKVRR
ncbi:MAG TPA: DegT/DnrJ/EryC1/StrS family aminotransferase [Thermoanaerobaculia bacterium]|nr:DegT/DnrJ/EryC1/StrS family aminotransferase [Thermoanaerobaculia bacterium]